MDLIDPDTRQVLYGCQKQMLISVGDKDARMTWVYVCMGDGYSLVQAKLKGTDKWDPSGLTGGREFMKEMRERLK